MGVITTDTDEANAGTLVADVLATQDEDVQEQFAAAVQVGVEGSINEQGLLAMVLATSEPLLSTDNIALLRDDADLAVVVLPGKFIKDAVIAAAQAGGTRGDRLRLRARDSPLATRGRPTLGHPLR